jgi:predicted aspartyl protease
MSESADLQGVIASLLEDRRAMQENVERLLRVVTDQAASGRDRGTGGDPVARDRTSESDIKLQKLTESDDVEAFLTTFERIMRAYHVPEVRWVYKLAPNLTGKAQLAYAGMPVAEEGDYTALKTAILKRYDINEESYRQRFRDAARKGSETYRELAVRVKDLLSKWLKEHTSSVEAVLEQVALEQFASKLPQDANFYMKEKKPRTVLEAGQLVDEYFLWRKQAPSENNKPARCEYCGKRGHEASECRKAKAEQDRANTKGKPDGVKPESTRPKIDRSRWKCFRCQKLGHIAEDCPRNDVHFVYMNELEEGPTDPRITRAGTVEGRAVERIILDTGCARTMVRQELIPHAPQVGQVSIRCAHGDTKIYPLARVRIGNGDVENTIEVAVSSKLPVPVLLGRDVTNLLGMLQAQKETGEDIFATVTRRQAKLLQQEESERVRKGRKDGGGGPDPVWTQEYGQRTTNTR